MRERKLPKASLSVHTFNVCTYSNDLSTHYFHGLFGRQVLNWQTHKEAFQ